MTIAERYRRISLNRKKNNSYKIICIAIFVMLGFSSTLGRFSNTANVNFETNVAKWNITINGELYDGSSTLLKKVTLFNDDGTEVSTILPGQTGYFDIVINPNGTEVSVAYEIELNMSQMPDDMQITGYTLNPSSNTSVTDMPSSKKITGNILLNSNEPLSESDKKVYRMFWKWQRDNALTSTNNYVMHVNVKVNQYI